MSATVALHPAMNKSSKIIALVEETGRVIKRRGKVAHLVPASITDIKKQVCEIKTATVNPLPEAG